jgi:3-mercaptopyruvate sulfurtransferase SseA
MAYDGSKLSHLKGLYDGSWSMWVYRHTDPIATVNTAGYFSDYTDRGVKEDDLVIVVDTTNHLLDFVRVKSDGDVTDGLRVTETDSD